MRIIVNENVSGSTIRRLRIAGHNVLSVREALPGAKDSVVLRRAQAEGRLLVTHDRDFGELAFRSKLSADCGIVLFRLSIGDPETETSRIVAALESDIEWKGHFVVVENDRIRTRPLP